MAWFAVVRPGPEATIVAGSMVEETDDGFFEGAWNSDFGRGQFDVADVCCGTGGRHSEGRLLFSTATDTLQALYLYRTSGALIVSNSLHLVVRVAGTELRLSYLLYDVDLMTIMHGLQSFRDTIPTKNGRIVVRYHCNLEVRADLTIAMQPKPTPPPFPDFAAYDGYLRNNVHALVENASAPARRHRFTPLATVSTGYDSPACAALASAAACTAAFTFTEAREEYGDTNDNGRDIGAALRLRVSELDPTGHLNATTLPECEFIAAAGGADDVVFSNAETHLANSIVFTGFLGDGVWSRDERSAHTTIVRRGGISGAGLGEFRLRVGFVHAAVPFFGCTRRPEICAISNSSEMSRWSVAGNYDRPIPRRIAEHAGVPRELFGIRKKAVARPYLRLEGRVALAEFLSKQSLAAFTAFENQEDVARTVRRALQRHAIARNTVGRLVLSWKVNRIEEALLGTHWFNSPAQRWRYSQDLSGHPALFYWASATIAPRYASAPQLGSL